MAPTGSSSLTRTYGRRGAMKRRPTRDPSEPGDSSPGNASPSIKRRKLSAEPIQRTPSPSGEKIDAYPQTSKSSHKFSKNATPPLPHPSPSKSIRDLSAIFDDIIPSKSLAPSPTKKAKRMLARSKTESSIEGQPTNESLLERTPSMPNFPSSSPKPEPSPSFLRSITTSIIPIQPPTKKTVARTYAGTFRSFLVPLPASPNDPLASTMEDHEFDSRESYSSLRNRWGVDNSEDDPYPYLLPSPTKSNMSSPSPSRLRKGKSKESYNPIRPLDLSGTMNPLKSISELRNKGESRRFLDDVGYLFEGMDSKGAIALRRASALEITTKLCDQEFTRKAKAADFFTKTWDIFTDAGGGKGEDKILDIIFIFFISLVARDSDSLAELAERSAASTLSPQNAPSNPIKAGKSTLADTLFHFFDIFPPDKDPLIISTDNEVGDFELKKIGISRKDRTMVSTVYKTISSKSELFSVDTSISISLLISYTLQNLSPSWIPVTKLPLFLKSLKSTLAPKTTAQLTPFLSLSWSDTPKYLPFENLSYNLRLLDAYLLDQWDSSPLNESSQTQGQKADDIESEIEEALSKARDEWLADDLVSLGVCVELNTQTDDYSQRCLATVLRILVSLTHADELWGRKVVKCEYTMGWLLRLIHRTGQDVHEPAIEEPLKDEDSDDLLLLKDDDTKVYNKGDSNALDVLCLALGLLTNLVQVVDEAKHSVRETRLNPSCRLKRRKCGQKCSCPGAQSGIEILADLYAQQQVKAEATVGIVSEDSPEARAEADASFLRGHLAVLFGLLMMNCPDNRTPVLSALPPPSLNDARNLKANNQSKMQKLVEHAQDFAAFYTAVSNKLGGEQDSKVAKDVVAFLEGQRDLSL